MKSGPSELRWAARRLANDPGSSVAAVIVLALSIACVVTVLAVARAVLFQDLPLQEPDRLVVVKRHIGDEKTPLHSPADLMDLRERCDAFSRLSASARFRARLTGRTEPTYVTGASVTPGYLETLGASPLHGEIFRSDSDGEPLQPHVVVVAWHLWHSHLGADQEVLGDTILLDGEPYTVVAVMPEELRFLRVDLWIPGPQGMPKPPFPVGPGLLVRRDIAYLNILGRLKRGLRLEAAQSALDAIAPGIAEQYPAAQAEVAFSVDPLKGSVQGEAKDHLAGLGACVGLVYVLGCLSISCLLLGRGIARADHDAIRLTLGATRRQALLAGFSESLVLATAGGILGTLGSVFGLRLFLSLAPPFPRSEQATLNPWLLAVAVGSAFVAALLAGLLPAMRTVKGSHEALVPTTGKSYKTHSTKLAWKLLLTLEVACMVVLLVASLILARRLLELHRLDLGFDPEGVLVTLVELPREKASRPDALVSFYQQVLDRLEVLPFVESVGGALPLPLSGGRIGGSFSIVGKSTESGSQRPSASISTVSHEYFRTMGVRVVVGRGFGIDDRRGSPPVVVVNQTFADRYWQEGSPVGAALVLGENEHVRVVGVVQDVRHSLMTPAVEPRIYRPLLQKPLPAMWLAIRPRQGTAHLDSAVRQAVHQVDPGQPITDPTPLEEMLASTLQPVRYLLLIVGGLAGLGVVITSVGLYALLDFTVREEERDLALRLAMGASRPVLLRMQVGSGFLIVATGTVIGSTTALVASGLLERLLPTGATVDPFMLSVVAFVTIASGTVASLIGARRVLQLNPSRAVNQL